jgi:acetyl-CoA carboxylase biotin carboxylase subunit
MRRALRETVIEGVETTIPFHLQLLEDPTFLAGKADTRFVERRAAEAEREAAEERSAAGKGSESLAGGPAGPAPPA